MRLDRARMVRVFPALLFGAVVLVTALIRVRLLNTPFERDEGEYALAGQLLLQGVPPYAQVYNMKFPGTYLAFALVEAVFGQTVAAVHAGLLVVNLASSLVLFLIGRRCFGSAVGALAGAFYAVLSVSPSVQGTSAHATQFLVLPMLLGVYWLVRAAESWRGREAYAAGAMLGLAVLMKQHAAAFCLFGAVFLLMRWRRRPDDTPRARLPRVLAFLAAGVATPLVLTGVGLWASGVWDSFWFWTFTYARAYVSILSPRDGLENFLKYFGPIAGSSLTVWLLAAVGVAWAAVAKGAREYRWLLLFAACSALSVCPGFYFRPHYFVTLLPAAALLAAVGADFAARAPVWSDRRGAWAVLPALALLAVAVPLLWHNEFFFRLTPREASRALYGTEPFPEAVEIGRWLRSQPGRGRPIFVMGVEPEIYFYAQRPPASGYIYLYSLTEEQPYAESMTAEMVREVEAAKPQYLVVERVPEPLKAWLTDFLDRHYSVTWRVDIVSKERTDYFSGARALGPLAPNAACIFVLTRKGGV